MTKLPPKGWNWRFHYGVRELQRAYRSSRFHSDDEIRRVNAEAEQHGRKVDAGEAVWQEVDEDGFPNGFDYGEHLGEQIFEAEQVVKLVRLAFVISLHHHVDQKIAPFLPKRSYEAQNAYAWIRRIGGTPQEGELEALRLTANCAKHSKGKSANDLYQLRPDLFDSDFISNGADPSYDTLRILDAQVDTFFDAVTASIPQGKMFL